MSNRAALYLRISKDDARTGLAVERQRDECLAVLRREGLELVETYTDNGVSAYARNVTRPAFDRMTEDYRRGQFDVVVCWDMDRFSRQPGQLEEWIEIGEERGLRILTPTEVTDLGTDNGRMFARMKATIARAEMERKSARQRAQVRQAKENGTYRPRVGFDDTEVIRRIFRDVLAGKGPYVIAKALNAEGVRTLPGGLWSGQAVRRVALTPRHRGGAVSEEDYDTVAILLAPKERVGAKTRGLYSGVARCSCGAALTASGPKYVCAFATNHPGAKGHQSIARHLLDEQLPWGVYQALLEQPRAVPDEVRHYRLARAEAATAIESAVEVETSARTDVSKAAARRAREKAESDYEAAEEGMRVAMAAAAGANLADVVRHALVTEIAASRRAHPGNSPAASFEDAGAALDDLQSAREAFMRVHDALPLEERRELARGLLEVTLDAGNGAGRIRMRSR